MIFDRLPTFAPTQPTFLGCAALCALFFAQLAPAAAQTSSESTLSTGGVAGDMRINVFGTLGFGGEADGETVLAHPDDRGHRHFDFSIHDFDDRDLDTTNGFGAQFDYALHEYFLLGGRLEFNFVDIEHLYDVDDDRAVLVNLDVVPKGRLPVAGAPIEFYLAMPVGPTLNFPEDDYEDDYPGNTDIASGVSWNLSLHAGLHYWFNSSIGVFVEQGWYHQAFEFRGTSRFDGHDHDLRTYGDFNQFSVQFGLSIGL